MGDRSWQQLLGLALPVACPGCGAPDAPWCARCAAPLLAGPLLAGPLLAGPADAVRSAAPYAGPVRALLIAWKERGRHDLTPLLAAALAGAVRAVLADHPAVPPGVPAGAAPVLLVPVPSSRAAVRRRGRALTRDLARRAGRELRAGGTAVAVAPAGALRLSRTPHDQVGLGAAERAANLHRAHRAGRGLRGRVCVLVDDVTTTGATLAEARRAVTRAGGVVAGAATVAVTPRRW